MAAVAWFGEASEEEKRSILKSRDSKNTKNVVKTAENILNDYLSTLDMSLHLLKDKSSRNRGSSQEVLLRCEEEKRLHVCKKVDDIHKVWITEIVRKIARS